MYTSGTIEHVSEWYLDLFEMILASGNVVLVSVGVITRSSGYDQWVVQVDMVIECGHLLEDILFTSK